MLQHVQSNQLATTSVNECGDNIQFYQMKPYNWNDAMYTVSQKRATFKVHISAKR